MAASPVAFTSAGGRQAPGRAGSSSGTKKAVLQVYDPPKKESTAPTEERATIPFQFNPKELVLTKTAKWEPSNQRKTTAAGTPQYTHSEPCKLSLEMFLDATAEMDGTVVKAVEDLFGCTVRTEPHKTPPWVVFQWGGLTGFHAFVSSVSAKYTLFTADGLPVRAVCTVTLEEIPRTPPKQNPTSGSRHARDVHVVVAGDTLAGIAFAHYGDPTAWRRVAEANRIDDPLRLTPGRRLEIPSEDEVDRGE